MLTFAGTYVMKLMLRWGWGWGGVVGHVNVRRHLRHEVDAQIVDTNTCRTCGSKGDRTFWVIHFHLKRIYNNNSL